MARPVNEINAGSMADIAFLLLIFFLVTTTMDVNRGITRMLPPPLPDEVDAPKVKQRNILTVLVNAGDQLLVNRKNMDISMLRNEAKNFLTNPMDLKDLPQKETLDEKIAKLQGKSRSEAEDKKLRKLKQARELLGRDVSVSKGIISLQNDRGTSYKMYITVQDELARAISELRDDAAKEFFGTTIERLEDANEKDKIDAISLIIPAAISEAEPKNIGG